MSKFDDMRASGNMMPTAALGTGAGMDEVDEETVLLKMIFRDLIKTY